MTSSKRTRQAEYTAALIDCNGDRAAAGKVTGIPRQTYHRWFKDDDEFKSRCDEIFPKIERDLLEECIRRAKEKSDTLMIFTLKALNPVRYDDTVRKQKIFDDKDKIGSLTTNVSYENLQEYISEIDPYVDYEA